MTRCPNCAGRTEWRGLYSKACRECSHRLKSRPTAMTYWLRVLTAPLPFVLVPLAMIMIPNAVGGAFLAIGACLVIGIAVELGTRRWAPEHDPVAPSDGVTTSSQHRE